MCQSEAFPRRTWDHPNAMLSLRNLFSCLCAALAVSADAAFTGIPDKGKYIDTVTFTVVPDAKANTTTTALLDGVALPVGVVRTLALRPER